MSTVRPLATPTFVMLGAAGAAACEGDACLVAQADEATASH